MSTRSLSLGLFLSAAVACGGGTEATDGTGGSDDGGSGPTSGASGGSGGTGASSSGAGGEGGVIEAGPCGTLCGAAAVPSATAGRASFVPPGCEGTTFARSHAFELPSDGAKAVPQLVDLDADGALDLLVNARVTPSALVLAGQGNGVFASPTWLPAGGIFAGGWGVDAADFTGDGLLDVAVGDHASGAVAWRNQGSLSFSLAKEGLPSTLFNGVGLGDVDGDGHVDAIFGADQFSTGLVLYRGDGTGAWTAAAAPALEGSAITNAGYIVVIDLDDDGDRDVVAFGQGGPAGGGVGAFVFENDGGLTEVAVLPGGSGNTLGNPVQGSVADVDCDGDLDVAAGGTVHLREGAGYSPVFVTDARIGHLGDLDGDGHPDLVTHSEVAGLVAHLNDGTGAFVPLAGAELPDASYVADELTPGENLNPLASAYGIDLGDVDGDGKLDIARVFRASDQSGFNSVSRCFVEVWQRQ